LGIHIQVHIADGFEAVELHMALEERCWLQLDQGIVPPGSRRWTGRFALSRN